MKRCFLFLAAILLAVLLLVAGCGENAQPGEASQPTVTTASEGNNTLLVTFNSNGGSKVSSQIVEMGEKISRPADAAEAPRI